MIIFIAKPYKVLSTLATMSCESGILFWAETNQFLDRIGLVLHPNKRDVFK